MDNERIEYLTLDHNWTSRIPKGYCAYHHKYITEKQMRLHRCMAKHGGICHRFKTMKGDGLKRMKTEQFYDKFLSRMDKICGSLDKIARMLEAIQKANEMTPLDKALREAQSMTAEEYLFGKVHKYANDEKE